MRTFLLLPFMPGALGSFAPLHQYDRTSVKRPILLMKRPKVADASDDWPEDLPSWALTGWDIPDLTSNDSGASGILQTAPGGKLYSVTNDSRTWELVLTKSIPEGAGVSPASAMLAPNGGCDNLCDEEERYTDTCDFTVSSCDAKWLLVRTEEKQWSFRISNGLA
jgi:hypothetical protein